MKFLRKFVSKDLFLEKNEQVQAFAPLKLQCYWTESHQILRDVARSSRMNLFKSEVRYYRRRVNVSRPISPRKKKKL